MTELYYLPHARSSAQARRMEELQAQEECFFCDPETRLYTNESWVVVENRWPYAGTSLHLLLLPRRHVTDLANLPPQEMAHLASVLRWAQRRHNLTGYSLAARNGDPALTGATIRHAHLHLIVGDGTQDVDVRLGVAA